MGRPEQLPLLEAEAVAQEFDFCEEIRHLVFDIVRLTPGLAHVDPSRLLISWSPSRGRRRYGVFASIYPLRFRGGATARVRGRTTWHMPRIVHTGRDVLYLIYFYLPRFFSLKPDARLGVVFHELFHVSERCDGDLRTFPGYASSHGRSVKHFEEGFAADLAQYKATGHPRRFCRSLEWSQKKIEATYGRFLPRRIPKPLLGRERATWHLDSRGVRKSLDPEGARG